MVTTKAANLYPVQVMADMADHRVHMVQVEAALEAAAKTQDHQVVATAVTEDRVQSQEQTIIGQAVQAVAGIQAMLHNHTEALAA